MRKFLPSTLAAAAMAVAAPALADSVTIDLTHPIPTFHATEGDPMTPDLGKPWLDSVPIPSFGQQAVLAMFEFPTSQGHFDLGRIVLSEHHGTHLDTPATTSTTKAPWRPRGWRRAIASLPISSPPTI